MNEEDTRIVAVKAMEYLGEKLLSIKTYNRSEVVKSLEDNKWFTCKETKKNHYKRQEEIHTYKTKNDVFIRTDKNETESDNLGELPEF